MVDGFSENEERKFKNNRLLLAWTAANIMNACGQNLKNPISVEDLMDEKQSKKEMTKEEQRKKLDEIKKAFGK